MSVLRACFTVLAVPVTETLIVLSTDRVIETADEEVAEIVFAACFTRVGFPAEETLLMRFTREIRVATAVDVAVSVLRNALEGVRTVETALVAVRVTGMRRRTVATLVAVPEIVLEIRLEIVAVAVEEIAIFFPVLRIIDTAEPADAVRVRNVTFI